jgi:hypothetical protein
MDISLRNRLLVRLCYGATAYLIMIGIKRPEHETYRLPPWSAEVKSVDTSASMPSHILMLRHLIKQRDR